MCECLHHMRDVPLCRRPKYGTPARDGITSPERAGVAPKQVRVKETSMSPEPTWEERLQTPSIIADDVAWGLRLALAFAAGDAVESHTVFTELATERELGRDRTVFVMSALAMATARLAHALVTKAGGDIDTWIYGVALGMMDELAA